jgi:hypothetical protein
MYRTCEIPRHMQDFKSAEFDTMRMIVHL